MAVCEATFGARLIGLDMARLRVLAITAVAVIAIPEAQAVDTSSNAADLLDAESSREQKSCSAQNQQPEILLFSHDNQSH